MITEFNKKSSTMSSGIDKIPPKTKLLHKPLRCHLVGLVRRLDSIGDVSKSKQLEESILHILVELARLEVGR